MSLRTYFSTFLNDRDYFRDLARVGVPIAIQSLLNSSLNMASVMMIGQKGDASVAAVGLAGQVFFLLNLTLFGITSGGAMFTAQLWGKKDIPNIRKVLGLVLALGFLIGILFWAGSFFFPEAVLRIYSQDVAVIEIGSQYLRIFSASFLFFVVTMSYASILRSIGDVRLPVAISTAALAFNGLLTYLLLFGKFGFPELGIMGAAWAIIISRAIEAVCLVGVTYFTRSPLAAHPLELLGFDLAFIGKVLKPVLPVAANELLWSFAITSYNVVFARLGTDAFAAMNIASTIDQMAAVIFFGIAHGTAVLVGNRIGAGETEKAQRYAGYSQVLAFTFGIIAGLGVYFLSGYVLTFYKVSETVISNARRVLAFIALFFWVRMMNMTFIVGIFRSGGDTRFAMVLDGLIIWIVGVPLTWMGGLLFHWPVEYVYLMTISEEVTKWGIGLWRYFSRKWIHDLTQHV